jgi:hypothetical protein
LETDSRRELASKTCTGAAAEWALEDVPCAEASAVEASAAIF